MTAAEMLRLVEVNDRSDPPTIEVLLCKKFLELLALANAFSAECPRAYGEYTRYQNWKRAEGLEGE